MTRGRRPRPVEQLRVVFDTNVYISAFVCHDSSLFALWRAVATRQCMLVTSPTILREFARIMCDRFRVSLEETARYVEIIAHVATLVQPKQHTLRRVQ